MWKIQPLSVTNNKEAVVVPIQPLKTPAMQNITSPFSTVLRFESFYDFCSHGFDLTLFRFLSLNKVRIFEPHVSFLCILRLFLFYFLFSVCVNLLSWTMDSYITFRVPQIIICYDFYFYYYYYYIFWLNIDDAVSQVYYLQFKMHKT